MYKYFLILLVSLSSCIKKQELVLIHELNDWEFQYEDKWFSAQVPGNNFSDLLNHGIINDPFYGTNEDSIQWIPEREWIYQTTFYNTKYSNKSLVFNGLDTYADVYLNDSLILNTNNMFRKWEVNVSHLLKKKNSLIIKFNPISKIETQKQITLGYALPGGKRVFTRKAGFHYGWDWGAKISPSGIWKSVALKSWNICKINDIHISNDNLTDSIANLTVNIEIESSVKKIITINAYDNTSEELNLKKGTNKFLLKVSILNPELWWPNGYGNQKLYEIPVSISDKNGIIDCKTTKIGLRNIKLVSKDEISGNEGFYFIINGKPIFMKGSNYVPQDNLQNRVTKKHYHNILKDVVDANMNMIRVWGGGIYEQDIFYNLCDSLGILVWQDFMFACAMYPSDTLFLENIKQEAIDNVKRLRHHPSIALWCGNNENSEGWHRWGWQNSFTEDQAKKIWKGYQKIFQDILPNIVNSYSKSNYWESSPKFGRGDPRHQFEGPAHYWGVWHDGEPFKNFEKKIPRFMSEFGFQSFPQISTIASFSDSTNWYLQSEIMQAHQKHPRGNKLITEYMKREYNVPKDFEKFIYTSQILQSNGMRLGMEAHRRNQPYCMGSLYWQLNDCWPVASWSSRDYYGNWKALHFTAQDVFAPISISLEKKENKIFNIWVISDTTNFDDTLLIETYSLAGKLISSIKRKVKIESKSQLIDSVSFCKDDEFIICRLQQKRVESKVGFTKSIKEYHFPKPNIKYNYENNKLKITTNTPIFQVYVHGVRGRFSDNFFTLLPDQEKLLENKLSDFNPNNLVIWSLYDLNKN